MNDEVILNIEMLHGFHQTRTLVVKKGIFNSENKIKELDQEIYKIERQIKDLEQKANKK